MATTLKLNLDWFAYYDEFKQLHGEPVLIEGKLLFPDGWGYAPGDVMGPEYPPPEDSKELRRLQLAYWKSRLAMVERERRQLREMVAALKDLQANKSLPLKQKTVEVDAGGRKVSIATDVDVGAIENGRLRWLDEDVDECRDRIQELE